MRSFKTSEFGLLTFEQTEVYLFPEGLHGFEDHVEYLLVQREGLAPFFFLQSTRDSSLRFICLPARIVDAAFEVDIGPEAASDLEISPGRFGPADCGVSVLTILTIPEDGPATANLSAPIVLVPASRRGRQCIQFGTSAPVARAIPWMVRPGPKAVD